MDLCIFLHLHDASMTDRLVARPEELRETLIEGSGKRTAALKKLRESVEKHPP